MPFIFIKSNPMDVYKSSRPASPAEPLRLRGKVPTPLILCLAALMLMGAGCAKRQQPVQAYRPAPVVEKSQDVVAAARSNLGVPYRFGGTSPQTGFDCSGLVCWTYEQVGISLPRRAKDQLAFGQPVGKNELQPGDIVVFKGTRGRTGWHSGIYTGNGMFIHSPSTGKTVEETPLDKEYYANRYAGARRIPRDGSAAAMYAAYKQQQREEALQTAETRKNAKKSGKAKKSSGKNRNSAATKNSRSSRRG